MKKRIMRISSLIGVAVFVYIIYKIGLNQIWDNITKISWQNFGILVLLRFLYWMLRTVSWKTVLEGYGGGCSLIHLLAARLGSHAINHLTPSANLGGDAARALMINHSSKKASIASVIVDKTIEFLAVIFFAFSGVVILFTRVTLPGRFKIFVISLALGIALVIFLIMSKQKKGFFSWIITLLEKLKIKFKFFKKHREKIAETDRNISDFYQKYRRLFVRVFLLYSLLMLFWTAEIHLTLMFLDAKGITFLDSFFIISLSSLALMAPITPASLGVYEAAYVGIFALLGHGTDLGLSLVLIRRIIAFVWVAIGLLGMMKISPDRQEQ